MSNKFKFFEELSKFESTLQKEDASYDFRAVPVSTAFDMNFSNSGLEWILNFAKKHDDYKTSDIVDSVKVLADSFSTIDVSQLEKLFKVQETADEDDTEVADTTQATDANTNDEVKPEEPVKQNQSANPASVATTAAPTTNKESVEPNLDNIFDTITEEETVEAVHTGDEEIDKFIELSDGPKKLSLSVDVCKKDDHYDAAVKADCDGTPNNFTVSFKDAADLQHKIIQNLLSKVEDLSNPAREKLFKALTHIVEKLVKTETDFSSINQSIKDRITDDPKDFLNTFMNDFSKAQTSVNSYNTMNVKATNPFLENVSSSEEYNFLSSL